MKMSVAIGNRTEEFALAEENVLAILKANHVDVQVDATDLIKEALAHPIATKTLDQIVCPGEKIAIITSDITRPLPSYKILPILLDDLLAAGCKEEDITVVFALGSHRMHTKEEIIKLVGEDVYRRVRCVDPDLDHVVHMGRSKMGTNVDIDPIVAAADRRICLANIEYHYFAGYSGGAKAIMPGVSTRAAIQNNHSRMVEELACAGNTVNNPVRDDIEEAIQFCPIDFIVNVVLDEHKKIVHAVAGHYIEAHRAGCAFLDKMYACPIPARADIVIVSQAGAPKDLNLYQTQKALDNAKHAVKKGGSIILVGSCAEGMGEHVFEEWMLAAKKPADLIERISREFVLGGHKAAAIAMVMQNADIMLVSDMEDDFVRSIFMEPYATVQAALDAAFAKQGADATVIIMPYGGSTLPRVE